MNATPRIPRFQRFPCTVLVRRAQDDSEDFDTVIAELPCRIYRARDVIRDAGFGTVIEGPHRMICDWETAQGGSSEAVRIRELDEVVHVTARRTDVYVVTSTEDPDKLNYNLECDLELRQPHA